jgi:hypothetical protein
MKLLRKNSTNAPATPNAAVDCAVVYAELSRPICNAKRESFVCNEMSSASVLLLNFKRNPLAVVWGVWAIVVNSLNRVIGRRLAAHVQQEVFKLQPSIAYGYAAPSVAMKVWLLGVSASSQHSGPCAVFGRSRLFSPHTMRGVRMDEEFSLKTAAAIDAAFANVPGLKFFGSAAVAPAQPSADAARPWNVLQDDETTKPLAGYVYKPRTLWRMIAFSHNFLLARNCGQRRRSVTSASSPRFLGVPSIIASRRMEGT